jgi:micrococcal nuclease
VADIRDLLRAPRTHWRVASDPVWQRARRRRRDPVVAWLLMVMGGGALGLLVAASSIAIPVSLEQRRGAAMSPSDQRNFSFCHTGGGTNCVVDGDTFWMDGVKIRIADIDTPETHPPRCASEAALGARATARLQALLNAGPIALEGVDRDADRYGRKLRIVTRGGRSLGDTLVAEGLARPWGGARRPWCDV